MWKGNKNLHDNLDTEYLKTKFLQIPGEGIDNTGRIKLAELVKGKILDIACGPCINYKLMKNKNYSGMDLARIMLDVARELYPELDGKLYEGAIQEIPFKDNEFDTIIARHIFEHIPDWKVAMKECLRVAKKYCYFVFYLHPTDEPEEIKYYPKWEGKDTAYYLNRYNKSDVESVFKEYEFKIYNTADLIYEVKM